MKAYVVGLITVQDPVAYAEYVENAPATIARYGGRYVIRNGTKHELEGELPDERWVVLEFPSVEQAKRWYESEAYQAIRSIRIQASSGKLFIIEGCDTQPV
ncbi:DUF1330 domain-containing protein [Paraburkholderia fungorum]|uniref:DUF1330 domain-containing protein n=1 Tax=Paraburkholderia fungorum TaxID=134537 RepID=UPI0020979215|nr:DUF1330 domain-containing protein [Paraburkholderia fungorum]USX06785.1 DUF1330 domain-containing protein [Paraburkholderia fungorum]